MWCISTELYNHEWGISANERGVKTERTTGLYHCVKKTRYYPHQEGHIQAGEHTDAPGKYSTLWRSKGVKE